MNAFIAAATETDAILARSAAHSAKNFGDGPEDVNWGHVCALDHYRACLRAITDMAFREDEHAV
ncbi:MAG: hypothetical protein ACK4GC_16070 [Paracoccaceae bacterium]